ncbi:MAG: hypothetical protein NC301_03245 [Bacteroides sp.]|nr:hypothetical protein [Bacteroides sp.]MCM1379151.1 hypothetical protein [Bacteroides sp.]MCM1445200.1 hypothetical protein [Prevotella sp.]
MEAGVWKSIDDEASFNENIIYPNFKQGAQNTTNTTVKVLTNDKRPGEYKIQNAFQELWSALGFTGDSPDLTIKTDDPTNCEIELMSTGINGGPETGVYYIYSYSYAQEVTPDANKITLTEEKGISTITIPVRGTLAIGSVAQSPIYTSVFPSTLTFKTPGYVEPEPEPEPAKAQVIDFDFVTNQYGIDNVRGGNAYFKSAEIDSIGVNIKINYEGTGSGMRFWSDGLRINKNGTATITISAPGHVISAVDFVSKGALGTYTVNGEPSEGTAPSIKTGSNIMNGENLETMTIAVTSKDNKALQNLIVVLDGTAGEFPKEVVEVTDIAAFLAAKDKKKISQITGEVTVTYQNGKYLFVTDATGSMEVYGDLSQTYTNGTVLKNISGTYSEYYNMPQFVPEASSFTAGTQETAVAPVEYDAATVALGQYIKLTDVEITETDGKYYAKGVLLYDQFKNIESLEIKEAEKATVTGMYGCYNSTYEIFVTEIDYSPVTTEPDPVDPDPVDPDPIDPEPGEDICSVADIVGNYEVSYTVELENVPAYDGEMTVTAGEGENVLVFNMPFEFDRDYIWSLVAKLNTKTGNITFTAAEQPTMFEGAAVAFLHWSNETGEYSHVTEIVANYDGTTVVFDQDDAMSIYDPEEKAYYTIFDMIEMTKFDPNADPNEGWKNIGTAHLMDGWVLPAFDIDQAENIYEVEMQQNEENSNLYRLVDPYKGKCPVADYNECTKPGYIEFDVTDPDNVMFSINVKAGFTLAEAEINNFYCYDYMSLYCTDNKKTPNEINEILTENGEEPIVSSTYKDGVITVNEACYGLSAIEAGYIWVDENEVPINMSAKIWFPGVKVGDNEEDGIREITANDGEEIIFNLRGQRISKATRPGIYIRNNQKVYVK